MTGVCDVWHFDEIASTQDVAKSLARQGAAAGTLVWADAQTAGRGRLSRRWKSPKGGLYFSLILRPAFPPATLADFSLMTARCLAAAIAQKTGIRTAVKPPNDVMALSREGKPLKIAGILAEASGRGKTLDWLVAGVGINVNNSPPVPRAASLKSLTRKTWDKRRILERFLSGFDRGYKELSHEFT